MCGIAGFWLPGGGHEGAMQAAVDAMTDALAHRGPDDRGTLVNSRAGVALGHRRLSILDLSPRGRQPVSSRRYDLVFNGEIYNFRRLREALVQRGAHFEGTGDTEVLLAALDAWGIEGAVQRLIGMFAFAVWDRDDRRLTLVRDRLGVKPLSYGWTSSGALWFGSELGAARALSTFDPAIDVSSLALLAQFSFIPDPWTVYRDARKLPPASIIHFSEPGEARNARPERYWRPEELANQPRDLKRLGEAKEAVREILDDSIRLRMISDVALGAFLSGGIDSSLVVAAMQRQSSQPVKTFTIGYAERDYDEGDDAQRVASHLGTEHHALRLDAKGVQGVIREVPRLYDEPFADSSQLPTTLVSRFARREVTVVLTGDGGDELFVGYNRHVWGHRASKFVGRVPSPLRKFGARILDGLGSSFWDTALQSTHVPTALRLRMPGDKAAKLAGLLDARDAAGVYESLVSHWKRPAEVVTEGPHRGPLDAHPFARDLPFCEAAALVDALAFLPGDILVKVDRASMSVGLEAREPLLDHRLAELSWRLPVDFKVRGGVGKWILRELLAESIPRPLFQRPKMGFGVPIDRWLRGDLREWAESLLHPRALEEQGVFATSPVRDLWRQHLTGHRNHHAELWSILMTQAWLQEHGVG